MTAAYAHARHQLALAFFCKWCRQRVAVQCTSNIIHSARRKLVPDHVSDEDLDLVMELMVQLRFVRKRGAAGEVAAAELERQISDHMARLKTNESITA